MQCTRCNKELTEEEYGSWNSILERIKQLGIRINIKLACTECYKIIEEENKEKDKE